MNKSSCSDVVFTSLTCLLEADAKRTCLPTNSRVGTLNKIFIAHVRYGMCVLQSQSHSLARVSLNLPAQKLSQDTPCRVIEHVFSSSLLKVRDLKPGLTRYEIRWMTWRNVYFIPRVAVINVRYTGITYNRFDFCLVTRLTSRLSFNGSIPLVPNVFNRFSVLPLLK